MNLFSFCLLPLNNSFQEIKVTLPRYKQGTNERDKKQDSSDKNQGRKELSAER